MHTIDEVRTHIQFVYSCKVTYRVHMTSVMIIYYYDDDLVIMIIVTLGSVYNNTCSYYKL